ncbi:MAG: phenylacetate--CoA ligase family protein [Nitrospiraceae bacterium]|nr:MAG: phenylacetate--CoA ligase family protein [Nitrospiraceae bacterium]
MTDFLKYRGLEFSAPDEIRNVQEQLFKTHINYIVKSSPYYRRVLGGVDTEKISLNDLASMPLTDKSAFEKSNEELLAVPMQEIRDIVLSSGTTGKPTRIMYTENDLKRLAYNEEISFAGCGLSQNDIVLLTCTMDRCFVAGLAYFLGIRALGAAAIRNGLSSFASHLEIIQRMDPTVIVGVPSFLHKLGQFLLEQGIDPGKTAVNKLICIGEPIRDRNLSLLIMGQYLEEEWGAKVYSTYASSETITTFCECTAQKGGHLHPELAIVEIVDEEGRSQLPGETGEVVVTTLSVEGMPLLRFRTGDVSFLENGPCECGRYSPRLGPILGRKKQMIKYRGTTLYPQSVYAVLDEIPEVSEYFVAVRSDFDLSDILSVHVSLSNGTCSPAGIIDRLQARLRVRPEVVISTEEEIKKQMLTGQSRKINRFIDRRKN